MSGLITLGSLILLLNNELPTEQTIKDINLKIPLRVYSSEGLLISEFGDERRKPLDIKEFPQDLVNAILSSEDDAFFEHNGIDIKGLIRAALRNFSSSSSRKQGASTITMQVARNFFLSPEQTYTRKITEILVAVKLEQTLSKDEILSLYLNKIFLGHRAHGFGAAAEVYYGKQLDQLTVAELAMLAGLPKAPSTYNPISNPERALLRRNYVLGRLHELDFINKETYKNAIDAPVTAEKHYQKPEVSAHHIAEMVRAELIQQFGNDVYWQGLNVTTTIKAKEQTAALKALRKGLQAYDRRHGFRGAIANIDLSNTSINEEDPNSSYRALLRPYPSSQEQVPAIITKTSEKTAEAHTQKQGAITLKLENAKWAKKHRTQNIVGARPESMAKLLSVGDVVYVREIQDKNTQSDAPLTDSEKESQWALSQIPDVSGSLISTNPNTGAIISLVGGYDFFLNKYNRATQSIRQPGSNIKPFIYSASLDKGFTPASLISGAPIVIRDPSHGTLWRPENYSGKFFGPTRMRTALAKSMNLVSIRLLRSIGIPYAREYTERFGIDMKRFSPTLTMALGSGGVTPLEVLGAYTVLANGGYKVKPYFIENIKDRNGEIIYQAPRPTLCDSCYQDYLPKPEPIATEDNTTEELSTENPTIDIEEIEPEEEPPTEVATSYDAPRVMSHANNFMTVSMLKDVVTRGTARKALALKRTDLAGKTGTTNDYVDAWFTGFNSQVATTVWVGFDKPTSLGRGEAGGVAALPIWVEYMKTALEGIPNDNPQPPEFIEEGHVNKLTGKKTTSEDPQAIKEYFVISELVPENALFGSQLIEQAEAVIDDNNEGALSDSATENNENTANSDPTTPQEGSDITPVDETFEAPENQQRIIDDNQDTEDLF